MKLYYEKTLKASSNVDWKVRLKWNARWWLFRIAFDPVPDQLLAYKMRTGQPWEITHCLLRIRICGWTIEQQVKLWRNRKSPDYPRQLTH
jgi:hypothetical protein